jgi:DNA polymerase-3 subunit alpha
VKEQRIEKITITIDSDSLDDTLVTDLATLIEESPGNTQLYIQILDTETKRPITLRSRNRSINIQRDLINFIHSNEGMSYKIN